MGGIRPQNRVDYDGLVTFDTKFHAYQRKTFGELPGGEARIAEMYLTLMADAERAGRT